MPRVNERRGHGIFCNDVRGWRRYRNIDVGPAGVAGLTGPPAAVEGSQAPAGVRAHGAPAGLGAHGANSRCGGLTGPPAGVGG